MGTPLRFYVGNVIQFMNLPRIAHLGGKCAFSKILHFMHLFICMSVSNQAANSHFLSVLIYVCLFDLSKNERAF